MSFKPNESFNTSSNSALRNQQLVFDAQPFDRCLESMEYYKNQTLKVLLSIIGTFSLYVGVHAYAK